MSPLSRLVFDELALAETLADNISKRDFLWRSGN